MYAWIQYPMSTPAEVSTYDRVADGTDARTVRSRGFDLSSIPLEPDADMDAMVVQALAVAEVADGIVYYGVPPRLIVIDPDRKPVGPDGALGITRFVGTSNEPTIG